MKMTVCKASAGTGKTYTLAAKYVALLLDGNSFRSILAVTFTNKATQEMKDRILLFLDRIARGTDKHALQIFESVRHNMHLNAKASDESLRERAAWCYRTMLEDYDNIHISTIDTFLLQLLSGLGQMLEDSAAGAAVELDLKQLLIEAVDHLLTDSDALQARMEEFVKQRLADGQSWDIRSTLINIAQKVYTESVQQADAEGKIVFDPALIDEYRTKINWRELDCFKNLKQQIEAANPSELAYIKTIERLQKSFTGNVKEEDRFRGFTETQRAKLEKNGETDLIAIDDLAAECRHIYINYNAAGAMLKEMSLMTVLRDEVRALLVERNRMLLAQTADKLHRALASGDADFILEKAGIRYHHILLDEFQDTSVLQWCNFKPLLEDILASGGSVFIVGDIKQSIYRWRNGDWTIMAGLQPDNSPLGRFYEEMFLKRNFRSSREVIQFNLSLFRELTPNEPLHKIYDEGYSPEKLDDYCRENAPSGYVQFYAVDCPPKADLTSIREHILHEMFTAINTCLQNGESPREIMILTRGHAEADRVINYYRTLASEFPLVAATPIVSCDSFHLDSSHSVKMIICALRWLTMQDAVAKAYINALRPDFDWERLASLNAQIPLNDLLEEILKIVAENEITDIAYVNSLFDYAHDYVRQHGSDANAFVTYWDDILHEKAISAPDQNAMRIMTIHSSKGLEADNVFIPFCDWQMQSFYNEDILWCKAPKSLQPMEREPGLIPIPARKALAESEFAADYEKECEMQCVDNTNLLYVALTRAGKRLFVYSSVNFSKNTASSVGAMMYQVLQPQMQDYQLGQIYTLGEFRFEQHENVAKSEPKDDYIEAQLHTGERTIEFRMSRESAESMQLGADPNRQAQIDLGNLCHSIMEQAETQADIAPAIESAKMSGLIADAQQEQEVTSLINGAWQHLKLCDWFSGAWEVWREATFLTANAELRPDRVMVNNATSTAIILDYKFGKREKEHLQQVRTYMRLMAELNFKNVEGWLWYAQENQLQEVSL